jgi:hypothetical protein
VLPLTPDLIGQAAETRARRREAERIPGEIEESEQAALIFAIGCRELQTCLTCVSRKPCPIHSLESLGLVRGGSKVKRVDVDEQRGRDHALIMKTYSDAFEAARKKKPSIGPAEGKAVKLALEKYAAGAIVEAIEGAFADAFWADKATIKDICGNPDRFRGGKAKKAEARQTR